jgi:hypothetical protein
MCQRTSLSFSDSVVKQPACKHAHSNRHDSSPLLFVFKARGRPVSLFSLFPSQRGEWSAGRRPGALRSAPLGRPCDRPACASCEDARALCEGPCASRRSIAVRIVGGRTLLRHPTSRSTTPSIEQGMPSVQGLGNGTRVMRITVFARWGWSSTAHWMPRRACGRISILRRHARACRGHPRLGNEVRRGWPGHRRAKRRRPSDC